MKKTIKENKNLVYQSNDLSQQVCTTLSVYQYRLLYLLVSHVEPTDTEFQYERFYTADLCTLLHIPHGGKEYKMLMDSLLEIGKQAWWMYDNTTEELHTVSWFDECRVSPLLNTVRLKLNHNLLPHLTQLKQCFTAFDFNIILQFKNKYSLRFYTLCKSWQSKGEFNISLDKLKSLLGCDKQETYQHYYEFVRKVVMKVEAEINEKSDIRITWQPITAEGKKSVIGFNICVNGQMCQTHDSIC